MTIGIYAFPAIATEGAAIKARLRTAAAGVYHAFRSYRSRRAAVDLLHSMSDLQLRDIGLTRADVLFRTMLPGGPPDRGQDA